MVMAVAASRRDWTNNHWKQKAEFTLIPCTLSKDLQRFPFRTVWETLVAQDWIWPFFLWANSCTWHVSSPVCFSLSCKMQILLKNASDCLYSLALLRFQIKEQPQHPPSSSLLFPSWHKINAYIFPRMLVSLPRTCHDIIFNSVFSSLRFFIEEPWRPLSFFHLCLHLLCPFLPFLAAPDKTPWSDSSKMPNVLCRELGRNTSAD